MTAIIKKDLEAFLAAKDDPSKQHLLDCYMAELEGSIKSALSVGGISQAEADELLYTYIYEKEMK